MNDDPFITDLMSIVSDSFLDDLLEHPEDTRRIKSPKEKFSKEAMSMRPPKPLKPAPTREEKLLRLAGLMENKRWRMTSGFYLILPAKGGAPQPLKPRVEQIQLLDESHSRNFIPKARKLGISTWNALDILDDCLFNQNFKGGIVDMKEEHAAKKLAMAKFAWDNGPKHPDKDMAFLWQRLHARNPMTKDSTTTLGWQNGSEFSAGVQYTGQTPNRLLISELGPIAAQKPETAKLILTGSIQAVEADGRIDIETTMEGGRMGVCYKIFKDALDASKRDSLSPEDYKLHFFSWLRHPAYQHPGRAPTEASTLEYFTELRNKYKPYLESLGCKDGYVPECRMAWWEGKRRLLGDLIWQQFPSVIDEVDRSVVAGQIYPEMTSVRANKRVAAFSPERALPLFIACDLGSSDNSAAWLVQPAGKFHNFLRCSFGEGVGAAAVAQLWRAWQAEFPENRIEKILLPHDANITDKGSGLTYKAALIAAGVPAKLIVVVPRTPDVWVGINLVRNMLPNSWFHSSTDEKLKDKEGDDLPSGVSRLEMYRKQPDTNTGVIRSVPVGDICSHASDAVRTYAEAKHQGLVTGQAERMHSRDGRSQDERDEDQFFADNKGVAGNGKVKIIGPYG